MTNPQPPWFKIQLRNTENQREVETLKIRGTRTLDPHPCGSGDQPPRVDNWFVGLQHVLELSVRLKETWINEQEYRVYQAIDSSYFYFVVWLFSFLFSFPFPFLCVFWVLLWSLYPENYQKQLQFIISYFILGYAATILTSHPIRGVGINPPVVYCPAWH